MVSLRLALLASARTQPVNGLPPPKGPVSYLFSILEVKPAFCSFYPGVRLRLPGPRLPYALPVFEGAHASSRGGTRREEQGKRREKVLNRK